MVQHDAQHPTTARSAQHRRSAPRLHLSRTDHSTGRRPAGTGERSAAAEEFRALRATQPW
ncbi:MAG: hypothetical protein HGA44_08595 [Cellulomonadaceae bacterium]|nr:hypothetical protein [Cellulomonadaceae bacterium]